MSISAIVLAQAVNAVAALHSFDAYVEEGKIKLHADLQKPFAVFKSAAPEELDKLLSHASGNVRLLSGLVLVTSSAGEPARLAPLLADRTEITRQTFDVLRGSTVAQSFVQLLCNGAGGPQKTPELLLFAVSQQKAFSPARAEALTCLAKERPAAAREMAAKSLQNPEDPLLAGALSIQLNVWLAANKLKPDDFHNGDAKIPQKPNYPTLVEANKIAVHARDKRREVRELVGKCLAWLPYSELDPVVDGLTRDSERFVRYLTWRTYMYRPQPKREVVERCLDEDDHPIASDCGKRVLLMPDRKASYEMLLRRAAKNPNAGDSALEGLEGPVKEKLGPTRNWPLAEQRELFRFLVDFSEALRTVDKNDYPTQEKARSAVKTAVQAMANLRLPEANAAWRKLIDDPSAMHRTSALEAASQARASDLAPKAEKLLETDADPHVVRAAAELLASVHAVATLPKIEAARARLPEDFRGLMSFYIEALRRDAKKGKKAPKTE